MTWTQTFLILSGIYLAGETSPKFRGGLGIAYLLMAVICVVVDR